MISMLQDSGIVPSDQGRMLLGHHCWDMSSKAGTIQLTEQLQGNGREAEV